jgi:hypothetical protein
LTAASAPESPQTIRQCASLLPKGKSYSFSLTGSIDTTGAEPRLSGALTVSDGTTEDKPQEGAAFAQCISELVR